MLKISDQYICKNQKVIQLLKISQLKLEKKKQNKECFTNTKKDIPKSGSCITFGRY